MIAGKTRGKVILKLVFQVEAPSILLACSKDGSILSRLEAVAFSTKGYTYRKLTKTIPDVVKILKGESKCRILSIKTFIFPARGPSKNTQAIAPRKGGVRRERKLTFLIRFLRGMFVLDRAHPIETPTAILKRVAPREIISVFKRDSLIA